jgi:quercetin dioxygenase-like cupin family protein
MIPRKALISTLVVALAAGIALLVEHKAGAMGEIKAEPILVRDLAGEPGKEVQIQVYTFPPAASVPWHIHPDTHEFGYQLGGEFTLMINGEASRVLKAGDAFYVPPNAIHRGVNAGREAAKFMVVRVRPKDKPEVVEVQP